MIKQHKEEAGLKLVEHEYSAREGKSKARLSLSTLQPVQFQRNRDLNSIQISATPRE